MSRLTSPSLCLLACTLAWLLSSSAPVRASSVGVYFDSQAQESSLQVSALQSFNWYVVASDVSAGIRGYEFYVNISPTITVTGRTPMPSNALNLGQGLDNWQVGTGTCLSASGPASLVIYTGMLLVDEDFLKIGLEKASPSEQYGPAYLPCTEGSGVEEFDSVTAAVLNADESSWGIVKSLYRD